MESARYRDAARQQFSRIAPIFARNGNFWRLGNAFDTIIDYFGLVDSSQARTFADPALDRYEKTRGDRFDDIGWWGIAALKAAQRPNLFPGSADRFKAVANGAWRTMADNAPKVWAKADQAKYADYAPRFEGGVWNADWTDDCNPIDPCNPFKGVQTTASNGLFLILSARLGCTGRADCQLAANRQYGFLRQWFGAKSPPDALLAPCPGGDGEAAFVRERVSAYGCGAPTHAYRPTLAWSGDQGLIVSGLIDRTVLEPKAYAETVQLARTMLRGAREYLADAGGVVQPWRERDGLGAPGGDADDYATGPGVFMRALVYVYRANPDLRMFLKQAGFLDIVRANAEKALEPPDAGADDDRALIHLANNLATLTAAVVMLRR
jgi:hypothetical protein